MKITLLRLLMASFTVAANLAQAEEYIVRFADSADKETAKSTLENNGFEAVEAIPQLNMYVAQPLAKRRADKDGLQKSAGVLYVEPNYIRRAIAVPNDKNYRTQGGMQAMGIERAWDIHRGSRNVVVAVIDTGIYLNHEDLKNQLWVNPGEVAGNGKDDDQNGFIDDVNGWDFINKDNNPNDDQSHGSHCAGIIGAEANNAKGIAGVTWNVQMMAVKFLSAGGSGSDSDGIKGIIYAADNGAHIINASWGSTDFSQAVLDAVLYANQKGVLFVAAAGNSKENAEVKPHYPSGYDTPNMLAVGAAGSSKGKADFSNFGRSRVHVAAPGVNIFSTVNSKSGYGNKSGTSMATPMVAGVAALLLSAYPAFYVHPAHLRNAIMNAAEPAKSWFDKNATDGFLRADWALGQLAAGPQLWPKFIRLAVGSENEMTAFDILNPTYVSSDPEIASVTPSGVVTAVKPGLATISAVDSSGVAHSAQVEVTEGKKRGGGCAAQNGAISPDTTEASVNWLLGFFLLPIVLGGILRGRDEDQCSEQKTRWH